MKDPFPERELARRHATLRAQAGSCTGPRSATPRGLSEREQIADLRPPHLETVNLRGARRRPGGEAAAAVPASLLDELRVAARRRSPRSAEMVRPAAVGG